ncbi:hypothetical protein SAMN05661080_03024 [Modestobacter sp. DSM 44400]|uniref:PKD domain-containing protein n=1 Tax=Modestobacter sp. DSM 44400 TaxID=1550230 RepID=UPI0008981560|nr:PKD domain-containing protein [Modestobacter sp. DSM 44400]SDY30570.1 hypothetical protein SAMN05661080_03024 [Modestobacter sp. DSM 44400]
MAEIDSGGQPDGHTRPALMAGSLLFVLVLLVSVAGGIGSGLLVMVPVVALAGGMAVVRGRAHWLGAVTLPAAFGMTAAGLAAVALGGAVPAPPQDAAAHAVVPPDATATTAPVLPPAPVMAVTCPTGAAGASPLFGRQTTASGPFSVTIDYGDGDSYTNDDQHLGAIFSHTYLVPGAFEVTAVLTDATGQTTSATCTYRWPGRA